MIVLVLSGHREGRIIHLLNEHADAALDLALAACREELSVDAGDPARFTDALVARIMGKIRTVKSNTEPTDA